MQLVDGAGWHSGVSVLLAGEPMVRPNKVLNVVDDPIVIVDQHLFQRSCSCELSVGSDLDLSVGQWEGHCSKISLCSCFPPISLCGHSQGSCGASIKTITVVSALCRALLFTAAEPMTHSEQNFIYCKLQDTTYCTC